MTWFFFFLISSDFSIVFIDSFMSIALPTFIILCAGKMKRGDLKALFSFLISQVTEQLRRTELG